MKSNKNANLTKWDRVSEIWTGPKGQVVGPREPSFWAPRSENPLLSEFGAHAKFHEPRSTPYGRKVWDPEKKERKYSDGANGGPCSHVLTILEFFSACVPQILFQSKSYFV